MKQFNLIIRVNSLLLILLLLAGYVTPALAKGRINTRLNFFQPAEVQLEQVITLSGTLTDSYDHPVADRSVQFTIDDVYIGQARTDAKGNFTRKISNKLDAGTYVIKAAFKGTSDHLSSSDFASLTVKPAEVRIQTVPPIQGLAFRMDNREFFSRVDGSASIQITKAGSYRLDVLIEEYHNSSQRVEFGRWAEESYDPFRDIYVPNNEVIQVGLNIYHQVGQSFQDLDGNPVDMSRIDEFMIRSAQGDVFVFTDGSPRWIPASRIARRVTGLEATQLLYSVISVKVDGSNVVNQSQQRFYTHPNETWPISVLLYSLHISANDALLGSPVGKSVNVEYPDGKIVNYPLNQAGSVDIPALARGAYNVELLDANGMGNRLPVALSRNQQVNAKIFSYLDMSIIAMLGAIVALGLLLYGRPWILHSLLRLTPRTVWALSMRIIKPVDGRAQIFRGGYLSNQVALPDGVPIAMRVYEEAEEPIEAIVIDLPVERIPVEMPVQFAEPETISADPVPVRKRGRRRKNKPSASTT